MTAASLDSFLSACRDFDGATPSASLRRATGDFISRAVEDPVFLKAAAEALLSLNPAGAAWMAVSLGAVIEQGKGVELTTPALETLLRSWLPRLPVSSDSDAEDDEDADVPKNTPEQNALLRVFPLVCQALVAHLARMPKRLNELAEDSELLERLEELEGYSYGAAWVRSLILRSSGPLILLHPPSGRGFRLRYEHVSTCFHLFSLIQAAIGQRLPGGRSPDPDVAAAARGQSNEPVNDTAWWHYGDPRSPTADIGASIWGEALARSIPYVNGVQVIILWPTLLGMRSWDAGFFGPHLDAAPPDVIIEQELPPEECWSWFERLGIEHPKSRA